MSSSEKERMERCKVSLPPDVDDEIEGQLDYGDSKSGWIREACVMRLEGEFDERDIDTDTGTVRDE